MKKIIPLSILFQVTLYQLSFAQHPSHHQTMDTVPARKADTVRMKPMKKESMDHSKYMMGQGMHANKRMKPMPSHAYSRSLPMNRNGSGTGWNPDASPMYMWIKQGQKTDWMFHGNIFLRYTGTDIFNEGERGDGKFSMPNWFMTMMNRKVGEKGLLNLTAMISLDPLTEGGNGYPLLFQSGETYRGRKLVDRQHPHDLVSGLSIGYTHMFSKDADVFGYFGYPGEPALGTTTFMHRVSSMNNPDAPLGHHWQDATHITFGVATLGLRYKNFKVEGSSFTGREPDEDRYDFDKGRFDSYSYRLSYNPTANWSFQFSQGFINSPEVLESGEDVTRSTASAIFTKATRNDRHLSAALIWGLNDKGQDHREHSILLEENYQFGKNALFSRYEFIQKSAGELELENGEPGHERFDIHAFSLGYNRSLWKKDVELTVGTKATIDFTPDALKPIYGGTPVGLQVYLQLRPSLHRH